MRKTVATPGERDTLALEATRRIVAERSLAQVKVVALTTFDDEYVFEALRPLL